MSPGLLMHPGDSEISTLHITVPESAAGYFEAAIEHQRALFLTPSHATYSSTLATAKQYLDQLASYTSELQQKRSEAHRRKRKRSRRDDGEAERSVLQLKQLYLDGFTIDVVWGQAKRILDASANEIENSLDQQRLARRQSDSIKDTEKPIRTVRFDEEGFEIDSDDEAEEVEDLSDADRANGGDQESEDDDLEVGEDEYGSELEDELTDEEEEEEAEDIENGSGIDDDEFEADDSNSGGVLIKDKHGLNDGFFDIDEFNRESEFMEQANRNRDDESEEEEIDYFADPMAAPLNTKSTESRKQKAGKSKEAFDSSEDEGPTFGDADLNAPWSDDEDGNDVEMDAHPNEDDEMGNANDILYADFFKPPPRALTKTKRMRALPKTQPEKVSTVAAAEDIQRTIDSVRRDLFEDDFSDPGAESDEEIDDDAPGMRTLSTHERRKVALAKQIRELEAAAIEKRSWQMSGEATAHARPENALLEEDLDFERAGKPVPVITAEVSSSIEDMIKQRILNRQFDEVVKRRPGSDPGSGLRQGQPRRGMMELSDQKDPQSLADIYEQSYLAQTDPNAKDPRSEALKAQHAEIENLWADVSGKLDALTSWRYKPKPAGVEVKVVTDAPKILMEDARPSGIEGVQGEQSGLAPQEVYHVGDKENEKEEGVVTTTGGAVIAKDELSKEDKTRRRRRDKERTKKTDKSRPVVPGGGKPHAVSAKPSRDEQAGILKQLKAGGVKVIGKGGELRNVDGEKVRKKEQGGGGAFKL